MAGTRRNYLVIHRSETGVRVLSRLRRDALPTRHALDLYLSRLLLEGAEGGEVILLDEETGRELDRHFVPPPRRRRYARDASPSRQVPYSGSLGPRWPLNRTPKRQHRTAPIVASIDPRTGEYPRLLARKLARLPMPWVRRSHYARHDSGVDCAQRTAEFGLVGVRAARRSQRANDEPPPRPDPPRRPGAAGGGGDPLTTRSSRQLQCGMLPRRAFLPPGFAVDPVSRGVGSRCTAGVAAHCLSRRPMRWTGERRPEMIHPTPTSFLRCTSTRRRRQNPRLSPAGVLLSPSNGVASILRPARRSVRFA
jgi:hypothetical protein